MSDYVEYYAYPLRYYPNLVTGEFLNVGIALSCPSIRWWDVKVAVGLRGFRRVFPTAQPDALRMALARIRKAVDRVQQREEARIQVIGNLSTLEDWRSPLGPITSVLGPLTGSIRWSEDPIEGVTTDPSSEMEYWFEQMVHIADDSVGQGVGSEGGLRLPSILRREFEQRGILSRLRPAEVGSYIRERFDYTYTNGRLHVFEAIRLNYQQATQIRARAQYWRGKLDSLNDGTNHPFNFFALVDVPRNGDLRAEANMGLSVIRNAHAHQVETFTRDQVEEFGALAERIVTHHQ